MSTLNKTKEELLKELQELRKEYGKLKASYKNEITERKRAEEALRESEHCLSETQSIGKIGNWKWIPAGNKVIWSAEMYTIFGIAPESVSLTTEMTLQAFHPEDRAMVAEATRKSLEENKPQSVECRILKPDGTIAHVYGSGEALLDANGKIVEVVGIYQDITERKVAEVALHALSSRQQALLTAIPDIIIEVDKNKIITWTNLAGLEFYGEDVLGKEAAIYFVGEQETYKAVNPLFDGSEDVIHVESWQWRKDGEKRLLSWWCRVLKDNSGNVIGALSTAHDITERTQIEKDLWESRQKFSDIITNLDEAYYSCTLDGLLLDHNLAFKKIFGFDPNQDMKGVKIPDLWQNPDERSNYLDMLMNDGIIRNYLVNSKSIRGEKIVVMVNSHLVKDENGKVVRIEGTLADFTERKQMEDALRESEERFRSFVENANDIIYTLEPSGILTYISPNWEIMLGHDSHEVISQSFENFIHPDDVQKCRAFIERVITTGENASGIEYRVQHNNGTWRWHSSNGSLIYDASGKLISYIGIARDITERKRMEEALYMSEESYRLLAESSPEMIYLIDHEGYIKYINSIAAENFYSEAKNVIGKHLTEIYPIEIANSHLEVIKKVIENKQRIQTEIEEEFPIGKIWIDVSLSPATNDNGDVIAVLGISRNITARKKAEAEIKLKTEQLLKANAEKDKFFSIIAHDLRSPFNSLLGFTRMMVEDLPTMRLDEIQKIAMSMRSSANKLLDLLENLLAWSLIQRGIISFKPKSFTLLNGIVPIVELVRDAANKKMIRIKYDIPEDLTVMADTQMFESLMRNLVFNAVKFTAKEGEIIIAAKPMSDNSVEISISDTGIGMNKNMLDKLFRIDELTNRKGTEGEPSTGLGLILCKDFVEKHGGKIWVESEEGKGSTFYFTLPNKNNK